ncbi:WD40 repeat domain-containing protein [Streptomyces atriruber]|uniref:WD40 repeat domain-containing protein n=1 Tax=Streptomyces atriruber TaxID=545121 RepID=UPI0006E2B217|nr:WD40 repeat domain-containing protein [Streptomyces atriruber]
MLLGPRRSRRRLARDASVAVVVLAFAGCAVAVPLNSDGTNTLLATMAGLFVGLASLLVALVAFFREEPPRPDPAELADDLARTLAGQWLEEAEARRLRRPRVLPLCWSTTTGGGPGAGTRVLRTRFDGRIDGRFDEVLRQLAAGYARLPHRRLVVIGEPGAGKTVLALLLTLGLLGARDPGGPVPVLLPVSSWDPVRERLDDWIVRSLAAPHYNGRPEIPRALLTHGLLLPVLDGLDEIPESARRGAVRGINQAVGGERPVVVTCRAAEYEDLILGGAPTLRRAPVVEVVPVPPDDVIAYLRDVDWPQGTDWRAVFDHLRSAPAGPLATALSTPLMVTSARLVYQRGGGDPTELLDAERFGCRYAVEEHITHGLIEAAYASDPAAPDGPDEASRWTAAQARRWLTCLARHLHDHRERDLAWWRLGARLLPRWAGPIIGIATGALLVLGSVAWMEAAHSVEDGAADRKTVVVVSLCVGGGFALFSSAVWNASGNRPPGRVSFAVRGSMGRLLGGFRHGAVLAALCAIPLVVGITVYRVLDRPGGWRTPAAAELCAEGAAVSVSLTVVAGLALAAHSWWDAPPGRAAQVSPGDSLAQDRRSALIGAATAGGVVAATGWLGWYAGVLSGDFLWRTLTGWAGWPGNGDVSLLAGDRGRAVAAVFDHWRSGLGIAVLLPGVLFALLVLMGRAWPRYLVTRVYLAARGWLPWRLMAFLADARRRELLRQSGGTYQFRHIRLQETLAGDPAHAASSPSAAPAPGTVRRRVALTAGVGAAAVAAARALGGREDESEAVFAAPGRTPMIAVAYRPGSGREFACGSESGWVWLWDGYGVSRPATPLRAMHREKPGIPARMGMAFHPDGRRLAVSWIGRSAVDLLDVLDPAEPVRLDMGDVAGDVWLDDLAFDREGKRLAGTGWGMGVSVWSDRGEGRYVLDRHELPAAGGGVVTGSSFLRSGDLAVIDSDGRVVRYRSPGLVRWSWVTSSTFRVFGRSSPDIAAAPRDDCFALFGSDEGKVWRRRSSDGAWRPVPGTFGAARTAAFHPERPLLATGGAHDGEVRLWHVEGTAPPREVRTLHGHGDAVTAMDFTSDGRRLATASVDGTVRLWNLDELL